MSSAKKQVSLPGFKIDPDSGKYVPIPVDFAALFPETRTKRVNPEWSNPRKYSHSVQPAKFRKTETGVRKELFKLPVRNYEKAKDPSKDNKSRPAGVRKSLIKCLPSKSDSVLMPKRPEPIESSHMLTITEELEQIEEPTTNKGYIFKSPITPQLKMSTYPKEDDVNSPESFESNENFLKLEHLCESPMNTNESPVSSVCNMFETNMLLNSEKKSVNNEQLSQKETIAQLRRTIIESHVLYQETSTKLKEIMELQIRQEENIRVMLARLDKLDESSKDFSKSKNDEEKENSSIKRRSLRLQNKSPVTNLSRPAAVSPVILKSGDLRKSTLTKSLVSKCQKYQIESPRLQKAIEMYNSTRSVCSALLTPKISKGEFVESPRTSNWRSNLSLKVQNQCLLLQDTPVHK